VLEQRVTSLFYHDLNTSYNELSSSFQNILRRGFAPDFVNYKKGVLYSQPQVIKITSCLPVVGGSLGYSGFFHH